MDNSNSSRLGAVPPEPGHRLLAALGPMMTELATVRASGVHTYLVPVEHIRRARSALGPDALIAVEQAVALSPDPREIDATRGGDHR